MTPVPDIAPDPCYGFLIRSAGSLIDLLRRDTVVVAGTVVALNLLRVVSTIILTRLLAPEAFGVVGIIMSVIFVLLMISDLGFQAFVVRHEQGDEPVFLDAIWTVRLVRGCALTLILFVLAEPIAAALHKGQLSPLIAASSAIFVIEGLSSLSLITALRDRLLLRLSALELVVGVVQLLASIALAIVWRNAWAILIALLFGSFVKSWLSYAMFPGSRRRWRWDRRHNAQLWSFARFVTGSSIITMLLMQADKVILSLVLSLDTLGLYILAGNLALAPIAFTTAYASRVLYPLYARVWRERPGDLAAVYYAARRRGSLLYMIAAGGLIGVAPLLIAILYDHRYAGAADYLRLLAITPLLALGVAAGNEGLTASGRVQATFHASVAKLCWLVAAGPAAFWWFGPLGLVAVVGAIELPALIYSWLALYRAGLFRAGEELLLLGAGGAGIGIGLIANAALLPFFSH
ncbi:oligosaccharide flippase family protein [Sphingomonas sp. SUN019]|uniref:oligosaccharide flippase family protein n=1 Tax=Sphingomonas sp. SUN019 TaxID=2937788 RepID=UPI00216441EB|nr:oligosaccharide flippase family protein [Sphingomonas sp. SUN019]UVO51478.1 oligosaccharide flippase family protein [Sphingomonas sp. SUN019]